MFYMDKDMLMMSFITLYDRPTAVHQLLVSHASLVRKQPHSTASFKLPLQGSYWAQTCSLQGATDFAVCSLAFPKLSAEPQHVLSP